MIAIGFRATPHEVYYSVLTAESNDMWKVTTNDHINFPKAHEPPKKLKHLRDTLNTLFHEFKVTSVGVRLIETNSRTKDPFRLNVEGVIQETLASSNIGHLFFGTIVQIGAALNEKDKKRIKQYIDGEATFAGLTEWSDYSKEEREAILAAAASIKGIRAK